MLEDSWYGLLGREHGGWENNDGAFASREIELEFNGRYTDYATSTHSTDA